MDHSKFDAALRIQLSKANEGIIAVSIRLNAALRDSEKAQMDEMVLQGADTSKRIIFAKVPVAFLKSIAAFEKVSQISLCQEMAPKHPD